jgi:hypothetical protein
MIHAETEADLTRTRRNDKINKKICESLGSALVAEKVMSRKE